jgi:hypothetical protein
MRRILAVISAVVCSACTTSGPTGSELSTGSISPGAARLVVYRISPMGLAIQPDYIVDGKKIAPSSPNGFLLCDLPPGRHEVAVNNMILSQNLFGVGSDKVTLDMRPGTTTYIHAEVQVGLTAGALSLIQVAEAQGRRDIGPLHKMDAKCA